ncbi:MAG TPA: LysR family transcriptional regulator [Rhizomicrobium sp.]|nr:LysR family transcriptional regulator [Rhizomicrobium sp.]
MAENWDLYRSFLEVARRGSLSEAARALGLAQPTLGRHIAALETELGAGLFARSPRGLALTETGVGLMPHAAEMALAAAALVRAASGGVASEQGTVRLTASLFVSAEVLPPILAEFRRAHPGIALELAPTDRSEDLLRREADIAVRMVRPHQSGLIAKKIGDVRVGLFAHDRYVRHAGLPGSLADLRAHSLIGFDRDESVLRAVGGDIGLAGRDSFAFRCDNDLVQLAALRAGVGIGGCQVAAARRDAALVPVLEDALSFKLEMWLVLHEDLRQHRRIRLLFDHLAAHLPAYVAEGAPRRAGASRKPAAQPAQAGKAAWPVRRTVPKSPGSVRRDPARNGGDRS